MNNEKRWFILRFEIENGIHLFSKYFHGGLFSVLKLKTEFICFSKYFHGGLSSVLKLKTEFICF